MKPLGLRGEQMKASGTVSGAPLLSGEMPSMMVSELLMYKQKTEQMTVLIKHYQTELESQKVRRDGVETVSRLLAESRQENMILKKKQAALEMMVKNLQNRLAVSGIVSGPEADDNEVIMPGTSKQTLTNLALENKRLRSLLQPDSSSDSVDSIQKTGEDTATEKSLQQTVEQLESENQSMKRKLSDLEGLFKASNNEKDKKLIHCHEEIQCLTKQTGGTTGLHKTVTGLSTLKDKLRSFMAQCQDFEMQLENVQETESVKKEPLIELTPVRKQAVERTESVDSVEVQQLLEERQKLQSRVEEVTQMNQRWQDFFSERDKYTKTLEEKVQDLDGQLKKSMHSGTTPEINRRIEQVLEKSQKEIGLVEEMRKKAEEEVEQLRQQVAAKDAQLSQLQSQMTVLARAPHQHTSVEAQSVIEHLKAQIQVCTEDFEKERQDRQIALQKVSSLQQQNNLLQKLNYHLQTLVGQSPTSRSTAQEHGHYAPTSLLPHGRLHYNQSTLVYDSPPPPSGDENCRHYTDCDYENASTEHLIQATGPASLPTTMQLLSRGSNKPKHSLSDSALDSDASKKENFLTCPKCNKEFSEEHQGELLAHMDVCWE